MDSTVEQHECFHGCKFYAEIREILEQPGDWILCSMQKGRRLERCLCVKASDRAPILILALSTVIGGRVRFKQSSTSSKSISPLVSDEQWNDIYDLVDFFTEEMDLVKGVRLKRGIEKPSWMLQYGDVILDKNRYLGAGNFSTVFLGKLYIQANKILRVSVAIKIPDDESQSDNERILCRRKAIQEAEIMRDLSENSGHIVKMFGIFTDKPALGIVQELCHGGSLDSHLKKMKGNISDLEYIHYLFDIAKGMQHVHRKGYLHRGLSTRNCLIASDGRIKIADFGLSCTISDAEKNDEKAVEKNMPIRWLAPEAFDFPPAFSPKSDVWSYGIVIWEVYNHGQQPWPNDDSAHIRRCITEGPMLNIPEDRLKVMRVRAVLDKCWIRDPDSRPDFSSIIKVLRKARDGVLWSVMTQYHLTLYDADRVPQLFTIFSLPGVKWADPDDIPVSKQLRVEEGWLKRWPRSSFSAQLLADWQKCMALCKAVV
ncbi:protein tyrosine kinase domain-containing protein [Ditylenchus destructor]|uniref:Protein tyrosine kinase domain-containing protein n=1 Tax=Ditylenchus destructor TaxID=166010 RepID=A0AAD4MX20_9BILA|nr:protein tyrosine kinase domain-containing protein [Ditylenchus destructor]